MRSATVAMSLNTTSILNKTINANALVRPHAVAVPGAADTKLKQVSFVARSRLSLASVATITRPFNT